MEANKLIKKEMPIEEFYKRIQSANDCGDNKCIFPPTQYVSDLTISRLINDGFKVYKVKDFNGLNILVLEW